MGYGKERNWIIFFFSFFFEVLEIVVAVDGRHVGKDVMDADDDGIVLLLIM